MEKAQGVVESAIDGLKQVTIGEKKPKVKKQKGGDGGEDA
jgi:threonyl-tRNA synthetase